MNLDKHNPSRTTKIKKIEEAEGFGHIDSLADLKNSLNLEKNGQEEKPTKNTTKEVKQNKKQLENTDKEIPEKEILEREKDEAQIIEWLKNEKIAQIVIHGDKRKKGENGEDFWDLTPDLDAQSASIFLSEYNKKKGKDLYTENAVSSIIPKGGNEKDLDVNKEKEGLQIWLDAGNRWMEVDNKGEKKIIYFDHHGEGKKDWTSSTEMVYNMMKNANILKEEKWMKNYVHNLTSFDNLAYAFSKKEPWTTEKFQHHWPRTLNHLAKEMEPLDVIEIFKRGIVRNFNTEFTEKDLNGDISKIVLKNGRTLKEQIEKESSLDPTVSEVAKTEEAIQNSAVYAINEKLDITDTRVGNLIYNNIPTINGKRNIIPHHLAFLGARANNFDTYLILNHPKGKDRNRTFFINSNYPGFEKVLKRLKRHKRIKLTDVRGVMIHGETNLTERDFLGEIDPKIIKNANFAKNGELRKNIENEILKKEKARNEKINESAEKIEPVVEKVKETKPEALETKPVVEVENKTITEAKEESKIETKTDIEKVREEKLKKIEEIKIRETELQTKIKEIEANLQKILEKIEKMEKKN